MSVPFDTIEKNKKCFSIFLVSPGHLGTIQNLIPGWTTIVKLLKQVKHWQSPSRGPWSNCLINSREDDKGQSYYYSGRQKDISKTICGRVGYTRKRAEPEHGGEGLSLLSISSSLVPSTFSLTLFLSFVVFLFLRSLLLSPSFSTSFSLSFTLHSFPFFLSLFSLSLSLPSHANKLYTALINKHGVQLGSV